MIYYSKSFSKQYTTKTNKYCKQTCRLVNSGDMSYIHVYTDSQYKSNLQLNDTVLFLLLFSATLYCILNKPNNSFHFKFEQLQIFVDSTVHMNMSTYTMNVYW